MKVATCGSLESNDCLISVSFADKLTIEVDSIVAQFFLEQIISTLTQTATKLNCTNIFIKCVDKGALDYTIEARLTAAIKRLLSK